METPQHLALGFATIERPQVAQRLIRSARKHLGKIPIYVADQSRDIEAMSTFYKAFDVRLVRMAFDAGVTASRNRLAQTIEEDFFVLCDDDFVIGPQTDFSDALNIFEACPEIGVVGGRLFDFDSKVEEVRNWEIFLEYDPANRLLISIPIYEFAPRAHEVGGVRFYLCDAVLNFAVMRREMFLTGVAWDERFKSNGEHEDFFLNLKLNSPFRVAYLPTMRAYHHHPEEYQRYRARLRDRNDGWRRFLKKWNIDQHLELGLGVKTIDDVGGLADSQQARARFFVNPNLSTQRQTKSNGAILVNLAGEMASVGALDERGEPNDGVAPTGSLLLDRRTGRIVSGPGGGDDNRRMDVDSLADDPKTFEKYQLETSTTQQVVGLASGDIYYRYDPVIRDNADFLLWYYCMPPLKKQSLVPRRLAVIGRWTGSDGQCLVWRTRRTFIGLEPADYWKPLLMEAPPMPKRLKWMRFDLVSDAGGESEPVCTGFVSLPSFGSSAGGGEALALSRLPRDGATPGAKGVYLANLVKRARSRAIQPLEFGGVADLCELPVSACAGLDVLFFSGWQDLGRSLVSARLPPGKLAAPPRIVLPRADFARAHSTIFGYGREAGLVTLRRQPDASLVGG